MTGDLHCLVTANYYVDIDIKLYINVCNDIDIKLNHYNTPVILEQIQNY